MEETHEHSGLRHPERQTALFGFTAEASLRRDRTVSWAWLPPPNLVIKNNRTPSCCGITPAVKLCLRSDPRRISFDLLLCAGISSLCCCGKVGHRRNQIKYENTEKRSITFRAPAGDSDSSPSLPASVSVISWKRLQTCDRLSQLEVRWVSKLSI